MINLMLRRWNEPPEPGHLHLSTLLHQVMAPIAQNGGTTATLAALRGGSPPDALDLAAWFRTRRWKSSICFLVTNC